MPEIEGISPEAARSIYLVLCKLAWCDGEMHPRERAYLDAFRQRFHISTDEGFALEDDSRRPQRVDVGRTPRERQLLLDTLIDVAAADGQLVADEQKRLLAFAEGLGLSAPELAARIHQRLSSSGRSLRPGG